MNCELVLIRHTRVDVPRGTCYGQTDVALAPTFEEEAAVTRQALQAYGPFDRVYSSPLTRARRLAAFCGYDQPEVDNRLMEMSMGDWEMQRFDDITDPYLQQWYDDYMHLPTPNGESFPMLYQRVASFLDELKLQKDLRRVAVFAHGGVLVCAGIYAKLFESRDAWDHQTDYGGIIRIEI